MKYSLAVKELQVKKVLPPMNRSKREVARETEVSDQTIRNWLSKAKEGLLSLGTKVGNADRSPRGKLNIVTPEFAVNSIVTWWRKHGRHHYPTAQRPLILADCGGSNGARPRAWKRFLQERVSDEFGLTVTVAHYPTGASKAGSGRCRFLDIWNRWIVQRDSQ